MNNSTLTPEMLSANPQLNQVLQFFQEKYGKEAFPDKILGKPETPKAVNQPMTEYPTMSSTTIDISKHNKADVLRVLYDAAKPQGMGFLHYQPAPMTRDEADELLQQGDYFDYVNGRVMKVRIDDSGELHPRLYDRDNGEGAAARAIATLG